MSKHREDPRGSRANRYQYLIMELPISDEFMSSFEDGHNINYEKIQQLREDLVVEVKRIMKANLTEKQYMVIWMYYVENKTQQDIAKELGVNQSSVVKCMQGNCDYGNRYQEKVHPGSKSKYKTKHVYGGALPKLRRICNQDPIIINILDEIKELCA